MYPSTLISEILLLIGAYLPRQSQIICLRVCKDWKQVFEQLVWDTVTLDHVHDPSDMALQSHRHLIKYFIMSYYDPTGVILDLTFPSLKTLQISGAVSESSRDFILAQESVKTLRLISVAKVFPFPATFWERLSGFKNFQALSAYNHAFNYTSEAEAAMFWNACAQTKDMYLRETDFFCSNSSTSKAALDALQPMTFPRLKNLAITDCKAPYNELVGSFIQRCPNLRTLIYGSNPHASYSLLPELMSIAKTYPLLFQSLEKLHLTFHNLEDNELAIVLSTLANIKDLSIISGFGSRSLDALRPNFGTLQQLSLVASPKEFSSRALQEVMSSCPLLERLTGYRIVAEDILRAPWICTKLRHLEVRLELDISDTNDMNVLVLGQISRLTQLEYLLLGYNIEKSVQLTLEGGLDKLSTLKCLRGVEVARLGIDLGDAEMDWIVAHWKKLEILRGTLHSDDSTDTALKMRLKNELHQFTGN